MAEAWWTPWSVALTPYAVLLHYFVVEIISADEFEILFLRLYLSDSTKWSPEQFDLLDRLFGDVDTYCGDDELRDAVDGLDGATLRQRASSTLDALAALHGYPMGPSPS